MIAFVLGCGESLNEHNLSLLNDYFTIGINRSFFVHDPTLLIWQDLSFIKECKEYVDECKAIKLCSEHLKGVSSVYSPDYYYTRIHVGSIRFDCNRLYKGRGSTGHIAVQIAYQLGCTGVVLLGMDCQGDDYYGVNPHWHKQTLRNCQEGLKSIKARCPIPIYNCSNNSYWPKMGLYEAIEQSQAQPLGREYYQEVVRNSFEIT